MRSTEPAPEQSTLGGQAFIRGGQSLKLSTKAAVFKRESLLIGGAKHADGEAPMLTRAKHAVPPWRRPWGSTYPTCLTKLQQLQNKAIRIISNSSIKALTTP